MDARKMLVKNSEELKRFVKTEQYKLSRELMRIRYDLSMSEEDMAKKIGVTFKKYVGVECGDEGIKVKEYEEYIKRALR